MKQILRRLSSFDRMTRIPERMLGEFTMDDFKEFRLIEVVNSSEIIFACCKKPHLSHVVLKKISKEQAKKNNIVFQVQNEISTMYNLDHPNIITLHSHFEDKKSIYLVMEYADRGNLEKYLEQENRQKQLQIEQTQKENSKRKKENKPLLKVDNNYVLSEAQALYWVRQIIDAIEYLHNKKIAHRNIRTNNFLLKKVDEMRSADIKLSNFDKSAPFEQINKYPQIKPSASYRSPEFLQGFQLSEKFDIWCMGIVIYELITGRNPFRPRHKEDQQLTKTEWEKKQINLILDCKVEFSKRFPVGAKDLLEQIFVQSPENRISIQEAQQHWWVRGLQIIKREPISSPVHEEEIQETLVRKRSNVQVYFSNTPLLRNESDNYSSIQMPDLTPISFIKKKMGNDSSRENWGFNEYMNKSLDYDVKSCDENKQSSSQKLAQRQSQQSTKQSNESLNDDTNFDEKEQLYDIVEDEREALGSRISDLEGYSNMNSMNLNSIIKSVYVQRQDPSPKNIKQNKEVQLSQYSQVEKQSQLKRQKSQYAQLCSEKNPLEKDYRNSLQKYQTTLDELNNYLKQKQNEQEELQHNLSRMIKQSKYQDSQPLSRNSFMLNTTTYNELVNKAKQIEFIYDTQEPKMRENYYKFLFQKIPKLKCERFCLKSQLQQLNLEIEQIEQKKLEQTKLTQELYELQQRKQQLNAFIQQYRQQIDEIYYNKQYMDKEIIQLQTVQIRNKFIEEIEDKYQNIDQKQTCQQLFLQKEELQEILIECDSIILQQNIKRKKLSQTIFMLSPILGTSIKGESFLETEHNESICENSPEQQQLRNRFADIIEKKEKKFVDMYRHKENVLDKEFNHRMQFIQDKIQEYQIQYQKSQDAIQKQNFINNKIITIHQQRQEYIEKIDKIKEEENQLYDEISNLDWKIEFIQNEKKKV